MGHLTKIYYSKINFNSLWRGHSWQRGCIYGEGGMCGEWRGRAWQRGGCACERGACMARGYVWQGGMRAAHGTHPIGMHSYLNVTYTWFLGVTFAVMRCTRRDRPVQIAPPEGSPSGATMAFVVSEFLLSAIIVLDDK